MTDDPARRLKKAVANLQSGRLGDADVECAAVLEVQPGHADALEIRGLIAAQSGDYQAAARYFHQALGRAPQRSPVTLSNLAEALFRLNKPAEALLLLREAIAIAPTYAIAYGKLALALSALGRIDEALETCREGLVHAPEEPQLSGIAAGLLLTLQRPAEAVSYLYVALERAPQLEEHWIHLYRLLLIGFLPSERARQLLLKTLDHPIMRPAMIAPSIAKTLSLSPLIAELSALAARDALPRGPALAECLALLGVDALLLALMAVAPVPNPVLERLFTALRHALLLEVDTLDVKPAALAFCVALANQAFLTEYAWYATDGEETRADRLASDPMGPTLPHYGSPSSRATARYIPSTRRGRSRDARGPTPCIR